MDFEFDYNPIDNANDLIQHQNDIEEMDIRVSSGSNDMGNTGLSQYENASLSASLVAEMLGAKEENKHEGSDYIRPSADWR